MNLVLHLGLALIGFGAVSDSDLDKVGTGCAGGAGLGVHAMGGDELGLCAFVGVENGGMALRFLSERSA
jgi:hypothetical protein